MAKRALGNYWLDFAGNELINCKRLLFMTFDLVYINKMSIRIKDITVDCYSGTGFFFYEDRFVTYSSSIVRKCRPVILSRKISSVGSGAIFSFSTCYTLQPTVIHTPATLHFITSTLKLPIKHLCNFSL